MTSPKRPEGYVHRLCGMLHDTLKLVTYGTFEGCRREIAQGGNQLRDPVHVRRAAPLVDGENVHAITLGS
jgi:hypothetical protein